MILLHCDRDLAPISARDEMLISSHTMQAFFELIKGVCSSCVSLSSSSVSHARVNWLIMLLKNVTVYKHCVVLLCLCSHSMLTAILRGFMSYSCLSRSSSLSLDTYTDMLSVSIAVALLYRPSRSSSLSVDIYTVTLSTSIAALSWSESLSDDTCISMLLSSSSIIQIIISSSTSLDNYDLIPSPSTSRSSGATSVSVDT